MRYIIFFVAAFFAVIAFVFMLNVGGGAGNKQETPDALVNPQAKQIEVQSTNIMVAKRNIPIGTLLKAEDLDTQPWPAHLKLPQFVTSEDPSVIGMVSRSNFLEFEPIIRTKLANPNDPSFLASSLPKGMRAITISIDAIAGIGGFVFPGDRVDVLVTQNIVNGKAAVDANAGGNTVGVPGKEGNTLTEVLIPNIKVLAVDQKSTKGAEDGITVPSNVTLEVSQKDAQRIRLAEKGGQLSLSLRSLKDIDVAEVVRPTGPGDLSRTTAPSFFPVLYGFGDDNAPVPTIAGDANAPASVSNDVSISVVRGAKVETVEVNRP